MTIIVGLVCKDCLVVAADSQTTDGHTKRCDTQKISSVQFADAQAVVAASGMSSLSNQAVAEFQKLAVGVEIKADDAIAQIAKDALFEVRRHQMEIYVHQYSLEQWQRFFRDDNPAELVVGYWFSDKPYLWKVSLHECVPIPSRCGYIISGVGGPLADYLLKEHFVAGVEPAAGAAIAAFVVEQVIANNSTCGHPIRIAYLKKPIEPQRLAKMEEKLATSKHASEFLPELRDNVFVLSEDDIRQITEELYRIDSEIKTIRNGKIQQSLVILTRGMLKRMIEGRATGSSTASGTATDGPGPKQPGKP